MEPYRLVIEPHAGFLHATVFGERSAESARRYLEEAYAACVEHACDALLLDVRFSGPSLGIGSIFGVISDRVLDGAALRRIAYVDNSGDDPERARFAEMVAMNRGVNVRLFRDAEAARAWLTQGRDAPA